MCTAALGLVLGVAQASAASPAPDPSPGAGMFQPDPYTVPQRSTRPAAIAPARVPVAPLRVVRMPTTAPAAAAHPKKRSKAVPGRSAAAPAQAPVPQARVPDHRALRAVALSPVPIDAPRRVSTALALALGALVLLSALFVGSAARELAR